MDVLTLTMSEMRGANIHASREASIMVKHAEGGDSRSVVRLAPVDQQIGWRLYQRRIGKGFSQADLARAVGVSFQQIHKYERGLSRVSASRLWLIANALDVEIDYFYKGMQR